MSDAAPDPVVSSPLLGPTTHRRLPWSTRTASPGVLVCDHASNAIPAALASLGLGPSGSVPAHRLDIGAAVIARLLAARLDAPAVLAGYSGW